MKASSASVDPSTSAGVAGLPKDVTMADIAALDRSKVVNLRDVSLITSKTNHSVCGVTHMCVYTCTLRNNQVSPS
jgi:hypothetical protein